MRLCKNSNVLEAGTPRYNALYNQTFVNTSAGQTLVSASTFTAQASAFGGTPAAAGAPPTGGGGEGRGRPPTRGVGQVAEVVAHLLLPIDQDIVLQII
jgi:hypothetical protein